jgi:hypothetical protein
MPSQIQFRFIFSQSHPHTMTTALKLEADSIMASDGLRYTFKGGGSPFQDSANMGTMSCYRCGLHKPRSLGTFTRFLNQRTFMCQGCTSKYAKPRD